MCNIFSVLHFRRCLLTPLPSLRAICVFPFQVDPELILQNITSTTASLILRKPETSYRYDTSTDEVRYMHADQTNWKAKTVVCRSYECTINLEDLQPRCQYR